MKRYIDADKLKEKLKELRSQAYSDFDSGMLLGNEKAQAALEKMPTADVAEVKHGEWKRVDCGTICTNCRKVYDDFEFSYKQINTYFKRCPECGAKMVDVSKKEITTEGGAEFDNTP